MAKRELSVSFDIVREKNLEQLKLLNNVIFPIKYADEIYRQCMASGELTQLAYHNDVLVGAVAVRCEKQPNGKAKAYIAMLGVLAPYRSFGIGSKLLHRSLSMCFQDPNIEEAYAHVQVGNDEAVRFYQRQGFEVGETVRDYYKKLSPPDALTLSKKLVAPPC
ncbi:N-alpha-acetyltransferase 50 [Tetrabaena socialis]|uniref:N-alpha-acetyltransferase 50 n=1 Tax=Tetrabaena socialis TaxID=47790 RepID=A0A2J8A584_9CHLO|nr:N-alpha-acetyltransferase 50 [Tetrabaena socialis]|eukprot:PNH07684.1 N-alpha-acetyltransferase 50 [Tetrabaena socialis]